MRGRWRVMSRHYPLESQPHTSINLDSPTEFLETHQRGMQDKIARLNRDLEAVTGELVTRRLVEIQPELEFE